MNEISYIDTYTGKRFRLPEPTPDMICLEDIAHSLSLICRYNGHCKFFYSVAQHCIRMSEMLQDMDCSARLQLYGLLHDASEAYICDIPGPVKKLIPQYKVIEKQIQQAIWKAFDMPPPTAAENRIIKKLDKLLKTYEKQEILSNKKNPVSEIEKQYFLKGETLIKEIRVNHFE